MRRTLPTAIAAWILLTTWAGAFAAPPEVDTVLEKIRKKTTVITTISSRFVQEKHLSMFDAPVISDGQFMFKKPRKLRWEYISPLVDGFALNDTRGVRWSGTTETRTPFSLRNDPVMSVVAAQLLAWASFDLPRLTREYVIEVVHTSPTLLRLTPKRREVHGFLTNLTIEFSATEETVRRVELHEQGGDFTRITFGDAVVNGPVADELFN